MAQAQSDYRIESGHRIGGPVPDIHGPRNFRRPAPDAPRDINGVIASGTGSDEAVRHGDAIYFKSFCHSEICFSTSSLETPYVSWIFPES